MRKNIFALLRQENGAALMMALFTVTILMILAMEIMYESNVELVVSSQTVNQVKARYAAKAGVELSLLRIHAFRKASAMLGEQAPPGVLDMIWQFPLMWPPALPEDVSAVDRDQIQTSVKESGLQGTWMATIESEGAKIDLNDLDSPSKVIADATRQQLLQMFNSKMTGDENFAQRNRGLNFEELVNNIADWVDENTESRNGGDESGVYGARASDFVPANQPFKTIAELHLVEGMTDELFDVIAPRLTVFGVKGVNDNHATKEVLMSLSPEITEERADRIVQGRADPKRGPFKDEADFVGFLASLGVNGNPFRENDQVKIPLVFESEHNFRIRSTGRSGRVTRDITAIVYDFDRVKERLKSMMPTPTPTPTPAPNPGDSGSGSAPMPTPTPPPAGKSPPKVPNERPNIVYWNET